MSRVSTFRLMQLFAYDSQDVYVDRCDCININSENNISIDSFGCEIIKYQDLLLTCQEKNKECSICYNNYNTDDNIVLLNCNHVYHKTCINNWINSINKTYRKYTCPLCRNEICKKN